MKIPGENKLKSAIVATTGGLIPVAKSPDEALGELFNEVQKQQIYGDGKTFVDLIPRRRLTKIHQEYMVEKSDPNFDLREFVTRHFYQYGEYEDVYRTDPNMTVEEHIKELWTVLERKNRRDRGSLIALPNPYIVPGGRFSEQFYWDTYFTMLGLAVHDRWEMIEDMMHNYTYMIRKFGFIPNASRSYLLTRSQPPFFSHMVKLLADHKGRHVLVEYLPYMLAEYRFWMKGRNALAREDHKAYARVVEVADRVILNRYYDNKTTPRPESLREDLETAGGAKDPNKLYLDLRAGAESGWDFSSRWFSDPGDIRTIHTTDIIPVDLNCLLYDLEMTIAETYKTLRQPLLERKFKRLADKRAETIRSLFWDSNFEFYVDYNFREQAPTGRLTLAALFPLFSGIATQEQAVKVAERVESLFLRKGGLVTTPEPTGQQWDAPNGWAPLHWIAIQGLRRYGFSELADEIKRRWIDTNVALFKKTGKLVEKYDVDSRGQGGGGEYPLQDGFGMTNGVLAALLSEK